MAAVLLSRSGRRTGGSCSGGPSTCGATTASTSRLSSRYWSGSFCRSIVSGTGRRSAFGRPSTSSGSRRTGMPSATGLVRAAHPPDRQAPATSRSSTAGRVMVYPGVRGRSFGFGAAGIGAGGAGTGGRTGGSASGGAAGAGARSAAADVGFRPAGGGSADTPAGGFASGFGGTGAPGSGGTTGVGAGSGAVAGASSAGGAGGWRPSPSTQPPATAAAPRGTGPASGGAGNWKLNGCSGRGSGSRTGTVRNSRRPVATATSAPYLNPAK